MNKEFVWVDYAKAIGIYLVVYGHSGATGWGADVWINSFHMPLFFIISGFLMKKRDIELPLVAFVKKDFAALMRPYYLFAGVGFLFWLIIARNFGNDAMVGSSPWTKIFAILYATGSNGEMSVYPMALWFFPCLFVAKFFSRTILAQPKAYSFMLTTGLLLLGFFIDRSIVLPFEIETALVAQAFVCFGYYLREYGVIESKWFRMPVSCALLGVVGISALAMNSEVNMASNTFGNPFFFLLTSLSFSLVLFRLVQGARQNSLIKTVSRNTLYIFPLHPMVFSLITGVYVYVLHLTPAFRMNYLVGPFASFANMSLILFALSAYISLRGARNV